MNDESHAALSGEVSADVATGKLTAKGHLGQSVITAAGNATAWLFPMRDARVKITRALADRAAEKIAAGQALDDQESKLLGLIFNREAAKLANQADVVERTNSALPEVAALVTRIPRRIETQTSDTFMRRAESIAGEIHEEELRELYARVLAGEVSKPGAFSIKTLETIRSLDPRTAAAFDRLRGRAYDCEWVLGHSLAEINGYTTANSPQDEIDLIDAGLITSGWSLELADIRGTAELRCGELIMRVQPRFENIPREIYIAGIRLTRTGREIASVLYPKADRDYFFGLGKWLTSGVGYCAQFDWKEDGAESWHDFDATPYEFPSA